MLESHFGHLWVAILQLPYEVIGQRSKAGLRLGGLLGEEECPPRMSAS